MSKLLSAVVSASVLAYVARPLRRSALSAPLPRINFVAGLSISTVPKVVAGSLSAAGYRPLFALSGSPLLAGRSLSSTTSPPPPEAPSNPVAVSSEIKAVQDQIEAVVAEIKDVKGEIKEVERKLENATRDSKYEQSLMDKEKQLRDKEKLLMEEKKLLMEEKRLLMEKEMRLSDKQNAGKFYSYIYS